MRLECVNILDQIESGGETDLSIDLSAFSCPANGEVEDFIRNKAIDFAKDKLSITYLVYDGDEGDILGFFTLTHKSIDIKREDVNAKGKRKLNRHARFDQESETYTVSAFLLAQFGKNFAVDNGKRISGAELMEYADDVLIDIQRRIGGAAVYLDAEDRPPLAHFYEDVVKYKRFGERMSESDGVKYIQYLKFI